MNILYAIMCFQVSPGLGNGSIFLRIKDVLAVLKKITVQHDKEFFKFYRVVGGCSEKAQSSLLAQSGSQNLNLHFSLAIAAYVNYFYCSSGTLLKYVEK